MGLLPAGGGNWAWRIVGWRGGRSVGLGAVARQNVVKPRLGALRSARGLQETRLVVQRKNEALDFKHHPLLPRLPPHLAYLFPLLYRAQHRGVPGQHRMPQRVAHGAVAVIELDRATDVDAAGVDFD